MSQIEGADMKYGVFLHETDGEFGKFISAGILITDENDEELCRYFDISRDFDAVFKFVEMLNKRGIELLYFEDMLEDFYTDSY